MSIKNRTIETYPQITTLTLFNSPYQLNPNKPKLTFPLNSRWTKQSFKEECDINTIMSQYIQTGELPDMRERAPQYLDVTGQDFQTQMEFVAGAHTMFHELPSSVRTKFGNDVAAFLDFTSNPNNRSEMAQMGLLRDDLDVAKGVPSSGAPAPLQGAVNASPPASSSPTPDAKSA